MAKGVFILHKRIYYQGLMSIPITHQHRLIRLHHAVAGHPGGERLWKEMQRFDVFGDANSAQGFCMKVQLQCEVCQVCDASKGPWKCHIQYAPIPLLLMDSVAVDLFAMPEVR